MKIQDLFEIRQSAYQYLKSLLPKWPDYVVKDWLYANFVRGPTTGRDKDLQTNQNTARSKMFRYQYADQMNKMAASGKTGRQLPKDYTPPFEPNTDLKGTLLAKQNQSDQPIKNDYTFKTIKQDVQTTLADAGLTADTKWQLVPNLKFTMDMWNPLTLKKLKERAGGTKNPFEVPRDAERHDTQSQLAKQQGGVTKEPVILIQHNDGYELLEGWHRTIQHFKQFPQGYTGPAWVARDENINENFADGTGPGRPGDSQRHGIPKKATMAQLEKAAKAKGRKGQLARWQINMRRGRKKANEQEIFEADEIVQLNDHNIELLFNPGYQRMVAMAKRQPDPTLRAMYIPNKDIVVVWPAYYAEHYAMAQALENQLGWNLGSNLRQNMISRADPQSPISAKFHLAPPMLDSKGRPKRDTNMHRRAGMLAVAALPKFYDLEWWDRIKRTAPALAEDMSVPQKNLAQNLAKLLQQVSLVQLPTDTNTKSFIVDIAHRPIVLVNFNGHTIPFYCSTGSGGKATVAAGKWYPFWGIADNGWFNKGTEEMINKFYYNPKLARTAELLNQYLGNLVGSTDVKRAGAGALAVINQHQQPMNQMEAAKDLIKYYARITTQVRKIGTA